ncbi:hypothetical protein [Ruminococcus sp.]|nr:hypothetical protein [Ruminococcus sp.]
MCWYAAEEDNSKAIADLLCVHDEKPDESKPLTLFDPNYITRKY